MTSASCTLPQLLLGNSTDWAEALISPTIQLKTSFTPFQLQTTALNILKCLVLQFALVLFPSATGVQTALYHWLAQRHALVYILELMASELELLSSKIRLKNPNPGVLIALFLEYISQPE
jgi:hypothetical protein